MNAGGGKFDGDEAGRADNTRRAIGVDVAEDGFEQKKEFLGKHEISPVKKMFRNATRHGRERV